MDSVGKVFWAKKKSVDGFHSWLPLGVHLEDTRFIIDRLWEIWLSEGQKNIILKDTRSEDLAKNLINFIGAIHDIGKATPVFQIKKGFVNTIDLDKNLIEFLLKEGFTGIDYLVLNDTKKSYHSFTGKLLLQMYGVPIIVASIIGAHHGKPLELFPAHAGVIEHQ